MALVKPLPLCRWKAASLMITTKLQRLAKPLQERSWRRSIRCQCAVGTPLFMLRRSLVKESLQVQVPNQFHGASATQVSSLAKPFEAPFEVFRGTLQQELEPRRSQKEQICQSCGAGQHDIDVQPPIAIVFSCFACLMASAIDDHASPHGAPLAGRGGDYLCM